MIFFLAFVLFVAFLGVLLFVDMSQHTLIMLYAGLHGVGLAIMMYGLFKAMMLDANPRYS